MADVKIVDIDGSQWSMKDQVARDKIADLEKKTTVKITNKSNTDKIVINLVEINDEKFLQLHINGLEWSGIIGETVATFVQDFGLVNIIRCMSTVDFIDGSGRFAVNVDIREEGEIQVFPITPNQMAGTYKAARLYGDAFIRVQY